MRFASLGSGSEGNALLIECCSSDRPVRLLIDCGFGVREARRRLGLLGLAETDLDAILITHEHGDHVGGAFRLARASGATMYLTRGTLRACASLISGAGDGFVDSDRCRLIDPDHPFEIQGVRIEPVAVPHDAREPVQYLIDDGASRLGVVTDIGHASHHLVKSMRRLDALLLECNHDAAMLEASEYPMSLKRRIAGPWGHLSNDASAALLAGIDQSRLRFVAAAHLSRQNNSPLMAREALALGWGARVEDILVADQDNGLGWLEIR